MILKRIIALLAVALIVALPSSAQGGKLKVLHNFGSSQDGSEPTGRCYLIVAGNYTELRSADSDRMRTG